MLYINISSAYEKTGNLILDSNYLHVNTGQSPEWFYSTCKYKLTTKMN